LARMLLKIPMLFLLRDGLNKYTARKITGPQFMLVAFGDKLGEFI